MRWKIFIPLFIVGLLIIPTIIISEIIYNTSRNKKYTAPEGYNSVVLETNDNLAIQGWYTNSTDKVVVIIHGHADHSKIMMERYVPIFEAIGYDILVIDLRNHGKSEKDTPVSLGSKESRDVMVFLDWVDNQNWDKFIVFGTSMGAIASLLAINRIDTSKLEAVVLDSMYLDPKKVMNKNFKKNFVIQPWRFLIVTYLTEIRQNIDDFPDIREQLRQIGHKTLIIHGSEDRESDISVLDEIDDISNPLITTARVEGGEHSRLFQISAFDTYVREFLGGA